MSDDRLIIVAYDIRDPRRWRHVFRCMNGYGQWIQLSVFQCRLNRRRRTQLEAELIQLIKFGDDHVILVDVGPADRVEPAVTSIGRSLPTMERRATVA